METLVRLSTELDLVAHDWKISGGHIEKLNWWQSIKIVVYAQW